MQIILSERFKKRFEKLPLKIQKQFERRLQIFLQNPRDPILKNHPLQGNLVGFRVFSVTGDYRVIFRLLNQELVKFIDIGTHAQAYE